MADNNNNEIEILDEGQLERAIESADYLIKNNDYIKALEYLDPLYLESDDIGILERIIKCKLEIDSQHDTIDSLIEEYRLQNPNNVALNFQLARNYVFENRINEAEEILYDNQDNLKTDEDIFNFHLTSGLIQYTLFNYGSAFSNFSKANEMSNYKDYECVKYLGLVYEKMNRVEEGFEHIILAKNLASEKNDIFEIDKILYDMNDKYPEHLKSKGIKLNFEYVDSQNDTKKKEPIIIQFSAEKMLENVISVNNKVERVLH